VRIWAVAGYGLLGAGLDRIEIEGELRDCGAGASPGCLRMLAILAIASIDTVLERTGRLQRVMHRPWGLVFPRSAIGGARCPGRPR